MSRLKRAINYISLIAFEAILNAYSSSNSGCIQINKYPINKLEQNIIGTELKEIYYEVLTTEGNSRCYVEIDGTRIESLDSFLKRNYYDYSKENFVEIKK